MRHQNSLRSPMGVVETMKAGVERHCRIGLVTING